MRRKVRVRAMHFRAVSGEVTQAAGAVHGRIMQLVGRGVDKGPAVCLQYCAHLQPFGRGVRLQRQQRAEQGLLLRLRKRPSHGNEKIDIALCPTKAAESERAVDVNTRKRVAEEMCIRDRFLMLPFSR